jgi:DNA invertase Pin-like site-specific DNA recombinase
MSLMQTKGKYIGYIRVSTKGQADSGLSLEAQEKKIRMYAELFDFEISHIEMDAGLSGRKLDRPGLQRALASIESGESQGLIIAKLDRLSRSVSHTAQLIGRYFASGESHLLSVADNLNTTTANGRMVINILSTMAQWEAEVISERTKSALQVLQDDGVPLGPLPYGQTRGAVNSDGRMSVVADEFEFRTALRIRGLHKEGMSLRGICRQLECEGVKTKKGKTKWAHQTIRQILDREGGLV